MIKLDKLLDKELASSLLDFIEEYFIIVLEYNIKNTELNIYNCRLDAEKGIVESELIYKESCRNYIDIQKEKLNKKLSNLEAEYKLMVKEKTIANKKIKENELFNKATQLLQKIENKLEVVRQNK